MDVGTISQDGNSFDIAGLDETESLLVRSANQIRWLYKDEDNRLIILSKTRPILGKGSFVEIIQDNSIGRLSESARQNKNTVGVLLEEYKRDGTAREVIVGEDVVMAYKQRIRLC